MKGLKNFFRLPAPLAKLEMGMQKKIVGVIQAHHLSWAGAADFSLARIDGQYAVEAVISRLRSVQGLSDIVIAVPDDAGNAVFQEIAARHGVACCFGSRENVLARSALAVDSVGGDIAVHVMGQHCFIDPALLSRMLVYLEGGGANYISMPDDFTPDFSGKIYRRPLLESAREKARLDPETEAINSARFQAFIENNRDFFGALIFPDMPQYDTGYLMEIRKKARQIFSDERMHVDPAKASSVSNPLFESYELAAKLFKRQDAVLDIACGDGYGCRIIAPYVSRVIGMDIDAALIAENTANNLQSNIQYQTADCLALPLGDGAISGATAMELIEHLPLERVDDFVKEMRRVVEPGGTFVCSTPQNAYGDIPVVPCHMKEYSAKEFLSLLGVHFSKIKLYCSKSGGRLVESDVGQKMVAVCQ
jgi:spore coat polysaccharide biosynthesis protein SpsF (cytidylyltransferase family)/ubiquinone/menaquinone biosynthesis C-methylase UbiE